MGNQFLIPMIQMLIEDDHIHGSFIVVIDDFHVFFQVLLSHFLCVLDEIFNSSFLIGIEMVQIMFGHITYVEIIAN